MAKRQKRLRKSIESIKEQIEEHFAELEKDIENKDKYLAEYHANEIDKSLIFRLEYWMNILKEYDELLVNSYKERLAKLKTLVELLE